MMTSSLHPLPKLVVVGACLALSAMLMGFLLGAAFGAKEKSIKAHLENSGTAVLQSVYEGDIAAKDAVVSKSWVYLKRAHLHGGAIGAAAIGVILTLVIFCRRSSVASLSALAIGSGALIYSFFWLLAGLAAPGIGSTSAAKESLSLIAVPGAGLCVLGVLGTIYSVVKSSVFRSSEA
jgi:hypothetical protein